MEFAISVAMQMNRRSVQNVQVADRVRYIPYLSIADQQRRCLAISNIQRPSPTTMFYLSNNSHDGSVRSKLPASGSFSRDIVRSISLRSPALAYLPVLRNVRPIHSRKPSDLRPFTLPACPAVSSLPS